MNYRKGIVLTTIYAYLKGSSFLGIMRMAEAMLPFMSYFANDPSGEQGTTTSRIKADKNPDAEE